MDRIVQAQQASAWIVLTGITAFLVPVIALHFLQPGYDPLIQLMSELALGPHGELMYVAFGGLALAAIGVSFGLERNRDALLLRALLVAAAGSFIGAEAFTLASSAIAHIAFVAAGFILIVLTMYLAPRIARDPTRTPSAAVSWTLAAGTAMAAFSGHSIIEMGLAQRIAASFIILWFAIAAYKQLAAGRCEGASKTAPGSSSDRQ